MFILTQSPERHYIANILVDVISELWNAVKLHLVILYSNNLEQESDIGTLCRQLADAMLGVRDEQDTQLFPTGGVRVLAYSAAHYAIADGQHDYAFVYLNLRMGRGRSAAAKQRAGEVLVAVAKAHSHPSLPVAISTSPCRSMNVRKSSTQSTAIFIQFL